MQDFIVFNKVFTLTFADLGGGIQEEVSATFQHTVTLQSGVGRLALLALCGTLTLHTVIITAWQRERHTESIKVMDKTKMYPIDKKL